MSSSVNAPAHAHTPADAATAEPSPRRRHRRRTGLYFLIALVLLAIGGTVAWQTGLKHQFIPRNWDVVEPGKIYRSGQLGSWLVKDQLAKNKIAVVLFMSSDKTEQRDIAAEIKACKELGIERDNFPLDGNGTGDPQQYVLAVTRLTRAVAEGKPVLVHCNTGAQRTGGAIALYHLLVLKRPPAEVRAELLAHGHDPKENPHMIPFLNQHMAEIARGLKERGVIAEVPEPLPAIP